MQTKSFVVSYSRSLPVVLFWNRVQVFSRFLFSHAPVVSRKWSPISFAYALYVSLSVQTLGVFGELWLTTRNSMANAPYQGTHTPVNRSVLWIDLWHTLRWYISDWICIRSTICIPDCRLETRNLLNRPPAHVPRKERLTQRSLLVILPEGNEAWVYVS